MSGRDKNTESPDSGLAALAASALFVMLLVYAAYNEHHANQRAEATKSYHQQTIASCEDRPDVVSAISCVNEALAAEPTNPYDIYDLEAQQDMAKWAALMFIITGFGVAYVALTLREARATTFAAIRGALASEKGAEAAWETVAATRDVATRQVRSYVGCESVSYTVYPMRGDGGGFIHIVVVLKNFGQSPAQDCVVTTTLRLEKREPIAAGKKINLFTLAAAKPIYDVTLSSSPYAVGSIMAGSSTTREMYISTGLSLARPHNFEAFNDFAAGVVEGEFELQIEWLNVFDKKGESKTWLKKVKDPPVARDTLVEALMPKPVSLEPMAFFINDADEGDGEE